MKTDFNKLRTKIFGIIEGLSFLEPEYYQLRNLINYAETIHDGKRKDGTPEFGHQLEMLSLAFNFHKILTKPLHVYMAIVIHDLVEDYPQNSLELKKSFPEFYQYSLVLSKEGKKEKEDESGTYYSYFKEISNCEVCSVVKLIDRVHNLSTAPGVFPKDKILAYCDEAEMYFFDIIKIAKQQFHQREVYECLKFMLQTQISTIRALVK